MPKNNVKTISHEAMSFLWKASHKHGKLNKGAGNAYANAKCKFTIGKKYVTYYFDGTPYAKSVIVK